MLELRQLGNILFSIILKLGLASKIAKVDLLPFYSVETALVIAPAVTGQVVCSIVAEATYLGATGATGGVGSGGAAGSDFLQPFNTISPASKKLTNKTTNPKCFIFPFIFVLL